MEVVEAGRLRWLSMFGPIIGIGATGVVIGAGNMASRLSKLRGRGLRNLSGILVERSGLTRAIKVALERCFDLSCRTKTSGRVRLDRLNIDSRRKADGEFYVATPHYEFRHLVRELGINPARYAFIDQGCGMGRVLLYAVKAGFRRVIGVEFSSELARRARENVRVYCGQERGDAEVIVSDAAEFEIPNEPCVVFFFNPFSGSVTNDILTQIRKVYDAGNREIYIIWYNVTANAKPLFLVPWLEMVSMQPSKENRNSFLFSAKLRLPYAIFRVRATKLPDSG